MGESVEQDRAFLFGLMGRLCSVWRSVVFDVALTQKLAARTLNGLQPKLQHDCFVAFFTLHLLFNCQRGVPRSVL